MSLEKKSVEELEYLRFYYEKSGHFMTLEQKERIAEWYLLWTPHDTASALPPQYCPIKDKSVRA